MYKFKVGDEVIRNSGFLVSNSILAKVIHITPTGRIKIKSTLGEETFNSKGYIRATKAGYSIYIVPTTTETKNKLLQQQAFEKATAFFLNRHNISKLSLGELELINKILDETWLEDKTEDI